MSPPSDSKDNSKCSPKFLCTFEGILKIAETFTVCVAWLLCVAAYDHVSHLVRGRYLLFLVVGVICWLFVLFVIFWNLCSFHSRCLQNKMAKLNAWYLFCLAYSLCWLLFWFGAAILLTWHYEYWEGTAAASFFSFINMILFLIDSIMYYRRARKYRVPLRKIKRGLPEEDEV